MNRFVGHFIISKSFPWQAWMNASQLLRSSKRENPFNGDPNDCGVYLEILRLWNMQKDQCRMFEGHNIGAIPKECRLQRALAYRKDWARQCKINNCQSVRCGIKIKIQQGVTERIIYTWKWVYNIEHSLSISPSSKQMLASCGRYDCKGFRALVPRAPQIITQS